MKINSGFIANYNLGDNIAFNLKAMELLYSYYSKETANNKNLMRKTLIIAIGSC